MTDTDNDVVTAELVEPAPSGGLDLGPLGPMLGMFGLDPEALGEMVAQLAGPPADPDAADDLVIALDDIDTKLAGIVAQLDALTGVVEPIAQLLANNAGKLKRLGIAV